MTMSAETVRFDDDAMWVTLVDGRVIRRAAGVVPAPAPRLARRARRRGDQPLRPPLGGARRRHLDRRPARGPGRSGGRIGRADPHARAPAVGWAICPPRPRPNILARRHARRLCSTACVRRSTRKPKSLPTSVRGEGPKPLRRKEGEQRMAACF